ncbi:MAG: bifunctional diaminohydroxyphosphoribosylaminopyrimidine deaminase/5-amino-6-(5-phosphoribosylamino)uracil reductase RibD [Saprospiraceae bacterium]|nr:bifunctional diaminohydroxyphosphoribosylaminopyrimidine deaminase/5-amino-6-(5-phosphoribosylamino)uracil reductase RibD [Saprospiraceae bacterium]|tara:strand:+ start:1051 stop:1491 length:441 start_codon:yes stop_codon:yes gene_type:complete
MTKNRIEYFMNEAILEGRKAIPKCLPNPPVGSVIVYKEKIVSRGHTNEPGRHHAEAMALENIKNLDYEELTMFVTLEPCSFQGRTPSCAKAIVKKGIKTVYVGILDPHPYNQGKGIKILTDANIKVEVGFLKDQVHKELNDFLIRE